MIFHYEFHCKHCGQPIVLHAETIGRQFEPQGIRTNDFHSSAVPCFRCKHVEIYSVDKNSPHKVICGQGRVAGDTVARPVLFIPKSHGECKGKLKNQSDKKS